MVKLPLSKVVCCTTYAQIVPLSTVSHFITCAQPTNCLLLVPVFSYSFLTTWSVSKEITQH